MGAYGFAGTNLISNLEIKHNLYGLDIVCPTREGVLEVFCWKDINSESFPLQALPQFDTIIHLVGKAYDTKNQSATQSYLDINTSPTQRIFGFFLKSSAKKFIFFGSVKVVADSVVGDMFIEDVIPAPVGPYGENRIRAEECVRGHFTFPIISSCECSPFREITSVIEKQVYILRPCMIHGPGSKGNLDLLYDVVKKGIPWPLGGFRDRHSFTSIDNLCYVVEGLLAKEVPTGVYHMRDDEALPTNESIAITCEAMGKQPHIRKMNKGFMEGCARLGTLFHLPPNTKKLRELTENYVVSNAKIKTALGIDKMPVTAKEGLIKTIRLFEGTK